VRFLLCLQRRQKRSDAHDVHNPGQIVGQDVQCHLGGDLGQALHQEVRCSHPNLHRAKGVLHRFSAYPVIAAIGNSFELLHAEHILRLRGDVGELRRSGIGAVEVCVPRVRDRLSGADDRARFSSAILRPMRAARNASRCSYRSST
jgi:hypothetical protein